MVSTQRKVYVSVELTENLVRIQAHGCDPIDVQPEEAALLAQEIGIAAESLMRFRAERASLGSET